MVKAAMGRHLERAAVLQSPPRKAHQNRPADRVGTGLRAIPHPGTAGRATFAA